jgi:NAD(P)-dependent dehydrogenase (short-subunit alcohol dehydrogenase family)
MHPHPTPLPFSTALFASDIGTSHRTGTAATRVALVAGAAGALGQAVVAACQSRGMAIAALARDARTLDRLYGPATPRRLHLCADLLDPWAVRQAVDMAAHALGTPDVLLHVAGAFTMGDTADCIPRGTWEALMDANVHSWRHTVQATAPLMQFRGRGCIVGVGAATAAKGLPRMGAYIASKSALLRLSEALAEELRPGGIRVHCLLPTMLDTPANRAAMPEADPGGWTRLSDAAEAMLALAECAEPVSSVAVPL